MNIELLKKVGNVEQLAGIREAQLLRGRGQGIRMAEFHNAAGLRFSVMPDRCMDLYDLSYKGVNLAFLGKNGLSSPHAFNPFDSEFTEQWAAGALVTCGLDNVGDQAVQGGNYPTHGRISNIPASSFGTTARWEGDRYMLRAEGEVHQAQIFGRHLSLRRTIETGMDEKIIRFRDVITNHEAEDEPYMLLYHFNFGYPLLQGDSLVRTTKMLQSPAIEGSADSIHMTEPEDGRPQELFFNETQSGDRACGVLYNERLELGVYVAYDTKNLPNFFQWKYMKSHDYVAALEPCNVTPLNRDDAAAAGKLAVLPAYSSVTNEIELGVLDGLQEIREFIANL
ncbi:MAG: DUF4432 family protein [Ruminococcaceae bacterium]|nr:DUF4432 family protein [Oscillospiraceae bacterium]